MAEQRDSTPARDERGRFATGNTGGPGGARKRAHELRRAAEEAVTPEHIQAMIRKALHMALKGDVQAMRFVSDRVIGRPTDTPSEPEPVRFDMPRLRTIQDCHSATEVVINAICAGSVERESAQLLVDAIQARLRAIEATEIEERLARVEQAAEMASEPRRQA
ncbi:MAG: DUF5681 domain-containing protein [Planctomycetota bacterium]